ncbi:MAG: spermidine synthase, partial [Myxococcaceae bacterium]
MPLAVAQPRFWASFLLFLSGATGLVYEVVWSKQLANLVGSTGQANVIVVATFMGGLALGAYLLGRRADVAPRPLALYGGLELAIGLYALVFPVFLGLAGRLYTSAVPSLPPEWRLFAKLLLASLTLLPPTLAMGGTVPALVRYFSEGLADMRGELARLYAVNSLGAALGCFVAGTVLLPAFGLLSSMRGAAIVNVLLGAVAMVLARRAPARQPATPPDTQVGEVVRSAGHEPVYPARAIRAAQVGLALTGFGTMVAEVAWIRVLTLVLGGSTYAFTLILSTFVLGIGLGSYWLSRRKSDGNSLRLFGKLQIALVVSVCVALPLYARLPYWFWRWGEVLQRSVSTWPLYQLMTFAMCALVLLLPTFWMGASFPCGARVATAQASQLGRQLGGAYLWNTIGTVLGSALGGLWLMPRLGLEGLFLLALLAHLAAAAFALLQPGEGLTHGRRWAPLALGLASLSAFMVSERGWGMQLAVAGTYRLVDKAPASYAAFREWVARDTKSLLHRDESVATVLVSDSASSGVRSMRINGKADASNDIDMETQVLSGHLGVLLHPRDVKRVLIVGMGSGVTAGAVLAHPVEHVDVVEISPAVIEGARFFAKDNAQALDDKRLHVHLEDAKNFLQLAGTYDLIISEPS